MSRNNNTNIEKKTNSKKNKSIATVTALALLVVGTYAWQTLEQEATNEILVIQGEPGGRLHDDFNGSDKDIYIENYADEDNGTEVFARIRLDEYMEYGAGAGTTTDRSGNMTILRGDKQNPSTPELTDVSTWDTYLYGSQADAGTENIRTYRSLTFGGSTVYMPTFNKDINSLLPDINGTYAGLDGDREAGTKYDDYVVYTSGDTKTADARYAWDEDCGYTQVDSEGYYLVEETHTAKSTGTARVLSMSEWKGLGSPRGAYWVYDIDGWAYWAQGIDPQTASGLLLDGIEIISNPADEWYYAVNVVSQIATAGDWGDEDEGTGMYEGGLSGDALGMLNKASGIMTVDNLTIKKDDLTAVTLADRDIYAGNTLALTAVMDVILGAGDANETDVTWSIEQTQGTTIAQSTLDAALSQDGTFVTTAAMAGCMFEITVTSDLDTKKSDTILVNVYTENTVTITVTPDSYGIDAGFEYWTLGYDGTMNVTATVTGLLNTAVTDWTLAGESSENTTITSTGPNTALIYVADDEVRDKKITIHTISDCNNNISGEGAVYVDVFTVEIDGEWWYVLDRETTADGKEIVKLFYRDYLYGTLTKFNNTLGENNWLYSPIRNTTLPNWINTKSELKERIVYDHPDASNTSMTKELSPSTTGANYVDSIYLIDEWDYNNLLSWSMKVSLKDKYGTTDDSNQMYTAGWWIRTKGTTSGTVMVGYRVGMLPTVGHTTTYETGVRPALWIYVN